MTNNPAGLLPVFAFVAAVVLSWPLAAATLLLATRVRPVRRAIAVVGGVAGVLVAALAAVVGVIAGPGVSAVVLATAAVAGVGLLALPLAVAAAVVTRATGVARESALRYATAGVPPALLVAFGVFLAPGAVGWAVVGAVVLAGPALVALALARLFAGEPTAEGAVAG